MIFNPYANVWANSKFMIMKKVVVLLLLIISATSCTVEDANAENEMNSVDINADSIPPTGDPRLGKDKNGVQGN
jgi:hypothetical protein